jgi:ABC-2 type transport system permease protein
VLASFAAALIGLVPRFSWVAWGAVALVVIVGMLGESLNLPQWMQDLSPFEHVPALPAASFDVVPMLILLAVASGFVGLATIGIRRRDIG